MQSKEAGKPRAIADFLLGIANRCSELQTGLQFGLNCSTLVHVTQCLRKRLIYRPILLDTHGQLLDLQYIDPAC